MRISVDASVFSPSYGGFISYIQSLTCALDALGDVEVEVLAPADGAFALAGLPCSPPTRVIDVQYAASETRRPSEVWTEDVLPRELERSQPGVHFGPAFMLPPWDGPQVVTVHDTMFENFPQHYSAGIRAFLTGSTLRALERADVVLAISEATARDARAAWPLTAPMVVTPLAPSLPDPLVTTPRPHAAPYLLNVGGSHRRKRLDVLVNAFERLVTEGHGPAGLELVIVNTAGNERVEALVGASPVADRIHLTPRVLDAELPSWYAHAEVFVYPSEYEGFGLTPLEAMACGAPVVAADNSAMTEVLNGAALTADPTSARSVADAIAAVLDDDDLRRRLVAHGGDRAAGFTWQRTAELTRDALAQAVEVHA